MKLSTLLLLTLALLLCTGNLFVRAEDTADDEIDLDETESTGAEDLFSEEGTKTDDGDEDEEAAAAAKGEATTTTTTDEEVAEEEEAIEEGEFNPIEMLGADLACSACELTLDTLVKNFGTAESVVRRKLEDEAAAKDTDEEDKKTADDEDGKEESDETGEKDEASDDDEKAEADKEEDGDKSEEEDKEKEGADEDVEDKDKDSKKKKKDKKKKDKKKKKKDKKKKIKKKPEIKVNKKAVAQAVLDKSCSAKDFESVKTIGSYPGRRYDNYGTSSSSYSTSSKSKKKTKASKDSGKLARACKTFVADHGDWIKQKLASPSSKDYKGMKKIKRDFCEKKNKMCKSAALGFEAESACLAKALRAATAGEFEKASKLAAKCPKVKSA